MVGGVAGRIAEDAGTFELYGGAKCVADGLADQGITSPGQNPDFLKSRAAAPHC